ncbi:MAG: DUF4266 domain-containing protein [Haliea sp.]|jgi:uncharacterized protein (DUF1015 family)|nr:DUF4266 domain-containing protein [Haliea sp.]
MRSIVFCVLVVLGLSACETVQPWERGTLAKSEMQWHQDVMERDIRMQVYNSKEAASGGGGAAGGGCGCN